MSSSNDAPGQLAGYLFQIERAVAWLAKSPAGAIIGLENGDDVSVVAPELQAFEQDKHSIAARRIPFADKSYELWNTLKIWVAGISSGRIALETSHFYMVTNKVVPAGYLVAQISAADTLESCESCVEALRNLQNKLSEEVSPAATEVLAAEGSLLCDLIKRIELLDGSQNSAADGLRSQIAADLHLPESIDSREFVQMLIGWVQDMAMEKWRKQESANISRAAFDNHCEALRTRFRRRRICATAKHLLKLPAIDHQQHSDRTFVKQLGLVLKPDEEELITEAIEDLMGASSEMTRLSEEGDLTGPDVIAFDNRLETRWRAISSRHKRHGKGKNPEEVGRDILDETLEHRESLAGQPTEEFYLTRGSYHRLADHLRVGWHPEYRERLENDKG